MIFCRAQILRPFFISLVLLFTVSVVADVQFGSTRLWRRATVIHPGQQVWSLQTSYQEATSHFNSEGRVEPLGTQYERALTWNQLMQADGVGRADLQSYMNQQGLSGNEIAATSTYQIHRREFGFGVNWAYGLSERWMIGLQIPVTLRRTVVDQQVELTPQLSRSAGQDGRPSLLALNGKALQSRVKQLAEEQLSSSGYDRVPDQKQSWDFGDISLLSQFSLFESYNWQWSLLQTVRFPTAQNSSVADYLQSPNDEGAINLGLSSLLDFHHRRWIFGLREGYVAQLPDSTRMRVNSSAPQIDYRVQRKLGDWIWVAADTEYHMARRWDLNAEYSFLAKGKDKYSGDSYESSQYAQLGANTDQELHQTRLGLLYRLGPLSSRSGVVNKWVASLDYTYPWIGHNAGEAAKTSLEIINYF